MQRAVFSSRASFCKIKTSVRIAVVIAIWIAIGSSTIGYAQGLSTAQKKSLYSRLGGKKAISVIVDEFVANIAADNRINQMFAATTSDPKRLAKFKEKLVDQICQATGGPCKYKGKDMKTAHAGMQISEADFNALVEDLVAALDKFRVSETEKNELLGALGPMKGDIVGSPDMACDQEQCPVKDSCKRKCGKNPCICSK